MIKIYDCFTFYNELDLLEIRLNELYDHVDYFVLVEGNKTFQNKEKPLIYLENKERFAKWADKIIHVPVLDMPDGNDPWVRETYQRNAIMLGVSSAVPDDIIMVSDCDEIPRLEAVQKIRASMETVFALRMPLFNFKFNYMRTTPGQYEVWGMAARKAVFDKITPNELRAARFSFAHYGYQCTGGGCEVVEHAGWHFGYLGDKDYLVDKAQSFSHNEVNTSAFIDQIDIEASIAKKTSWLQTSNEQYEIVELNDYFPASLLDPRFNNYVLANSSAVATQFLPPYPYSS